MIPRLAEVREGAGTGKGKGKGRDEKS